MFDDVRAPAREAAAEWVPTEQLRPWAENPRQNDAAVAGVAASIKQFGFGSPLLARRENGEIIAGHTRLKAALELGLAQVPVRSLDLDPAQAHLLAIADNKTGEAAAWDDAVLAGVLTELQQAGADVLTSGFSQAEIDALLVKKVDPPLEGEDAPPGALPVEPQSKLGEVYELGPHRLLCGDATGIEGLEQMMRGELAHLVFTDPPYNVAYQGGLRDGLRDKQTPSDEGMRIENDAQTDAEFRQFLRDAFSAMSAVTHPGGAIYVCHADRETENFRGALRESGWLFKQCLVWVKQMFVLGRQDYHWKHEPILYGRKDGGSHRWFSDRKQTSVWEFDKPSRSVDHPTTKPVELVAYALVNSSAEGDVVLDPFGGSGTTLIAAAQTGRSARLVELDPKYCDVIRKRWTAFAKSAGASPGSGGLDA